MSIILISINFLITLSYIFENVVKILTGGKFDIWFSLKVPLSSGKTMAILASSGKMPLIKYYLLYCLLLFIVFIAIFISLEGIISKLTAFFMLSVLKSSNISSGFVPQALLEDVIEGIWFLEVVLIRLMLEWYKCDWKIKSIACLVSEMF